MKICPSCGEENPDRFPLCGFCGTAFESVVPAREVRKSVTVVFSDLRGSTRLAEALDSESLREVMSRYFDEMREVLESHGGVVEKYIGDAVMAVFGLPTAHEDDALRAVRAARAMTLALAALNEELEGRWGVRLANRTGVNTGEVVAGDPSGGQRLVTGDAVNVAARLEQAAPADEVLIGEPTYRLVRDAVDVERLQPLTVKGKSEPLAAFRLLSVADVRAAPRRHDLPLVGRERELEVLSGVLDSALSSSACRLVTLLGDAGLGKSRLVEELCGLARSRGAVVARGRCLPYGRGITFWPMVEIVRELAAIAEDDAPDEAVAKIAALAADHEISERIAAMLGLTAAQYPLDELYWATRKLFERHGRERPLVAVYEDVHWAEQALLDLVEHTLANAHGVPLLLVCSSRPDLKERRPDWGRLDRAAEVELAPLSPEAATRVIEQRLGSTDVPDEVRQRIVGSADGNPLFVEQLIAMLIDEGALRRDDGRWIAAPQLAELPSIPPTIEALLAARLDLLPPEELGVLEAAAVIGTIFPRSALDALVPDVARPAVGSHLLSLARKRFVAPASREADGEGGGAEGSLRFHHVLIRDAAYNRLLKRARADLHERFADWAETVNRGRDREHEYVEIVGYHLEQAARYLGELAPLDERGRRLAARAASHLGPAGRRAFRRGDMGAAANLLRRTVALLPEGSHERLALLPELAEAMMEIGEFAWASVFVDEAVAEATGLGDEILEADALLTRLLVRHRTTDDLDGWRAEVEREATRVIELLDAESAPAVLAKAWRLIGFVHGTVCAWGATAAANERAIEHARRAGDARQEARMSAAYVMALTDGPTPTSTAVARAQEIVERGLVDGQAEAVILLSLASLRGMRGELEEARALTRQAFALLRDRGATVLAAHTSLTAGRVELLAGNAASAEAELRRDFEQLAALDERYFRPLVGALLARALVELGRLDEAEATARAAAELAAPHDVEAQVVVRTVDALIHSQRGLHREAGRLGREALALVTTADAPVLEADVLVDLATVHLRAGRAEDGARALDEALRLYERKEHLVGAAHTRAALSVEAAPTRA